MQNIVQLERKLGQMLLNQNFQSVDPDKETLNMYRDIIRSYSLLENKIVLLSDYLEDKCYMYSGSYGVNFGLQAGETRITSIFEQQVFKIVHPQDLLERQALEIGFIHLQKQIQPSERSNYTSHCNLRMKGINGKYLIVSHTMQYIRSFENGSIWLAMCTYSPSTDIIPSNGINGRILNSFTGEVTPIRGIKNVHNNILTRRETQILKHLGKGCTSKEISLELNLSTNTIYRHRQNIIEKLNVHNSSEAVQVGIILGLLK